MRPTHAGCMPNPRLHLLPRIRGPAVRLVGFDAAICVVLLLQPGRSSQVDLSDDLLDMPACGSCVASP